MPGLLGRLSWDEDVFGRAYALFLLRQAPALRVTASAQAGTATEVLVAQP